MTTTESSTAWEKELAQLTERFLNGLPKRLEDVHVQVREGNWKEAMALVHRLKGASSSYGFKEVAEEARSFEVALRAQKYDLAPQHLEKIASAISEKLSLHNNSRH